MLNSHCSCISPGGEKEKERRGPAPRRELAFYRTRAGRAMPRPRPTSRRARVSSLVGQERAGLLGDVLLDLGELAVIAGGVLVVFDRDRAVLGRGFLGTRVDDLAATLPVQLVAVLAEGRQ